MPYASRRVTALLLTVIAATPALAQTPGDARAGKAVASALCVQCHRIDRAERSEPRSPPDFGAIADMASTTSLALRAFLQTPHGDMPRYQLSPAEMDDVIAYIIGLRAR
ncbi:MAG: c-type cytochrome [Bosea sp. (in: a-proteobacteria)]